MIIIYICVIHNTHLFSASEKRIWQTYKIKELPKPAQSAMNTWINKNPGWKHELYDDSDIENYILKFWDERMYKSDCEMENTRKYRIIGCLINRA